MSYTADRMYARGWNHERRRLIESYRDRSLIGWEMRYQMLRDAGYFEAVARLEGRLEIERQELLNASMKRQLRATQVEHVKALVAYLAEVEAAIASALKVNLEVGELIAFGLKVPVTDKSDHEPIPPWEWAQLTLDPRASSAQGYGLVYVGIYFAPLVKNAESELGRRLAPLLGVPELGNLATRISATRQITPRLEAALDRAHPTNRTERAVAALDAIPAAFRRDTLDDTDRAARRKPGPRNSNEAIVKAIRDLVASGRLKPGQSWPRITKLVNGAIGKVHDGSKGGVLSVSTVRRHGRATYVDLCAKTSPQK